MLDEKLKLVDEELFILGEKLNLLQLITPINWEIEKEKFFENKKYSPRFEYEIDLEFFDKVEDDLVGMKIETKEWQGFLLQEVKENFLEDLKLIRTIGSDREEFQKCNLEKYVSKDDFEDEEILKLAENELKSAKIEKEKSSFGALYVKEVFEDFLNENEIEWKVEVDESLIPLLAVNSFEKKILMNPLIVLTKRELQKILVHEIETHIYRALNGMHLFKMATAGLKNYEKTEEGLAAYNESLVFPEDKGSLKRFFDRYQSVLFAQEHSFKEVFDYLCDEFRFGEEEAWRIALRVKRGLGDTSQKGAFLKDRIYLQGYFAVRELSREEIKNLYKGKFSLEHLHSKQFNLGDDDLIQKPKYLPKIYKK